MQAYFMKRWKRCTTPDPISRLLSTSWRSWIPNMGYFRKQAAMHEHFGRKSQLAAAILTFLRFTKTVHHSQNLLAFEKSQTPCENTLFFLLWRSAERSSTGQVSLLVSHARVSGFGPIGATKFLLRKAEPVCRDLKEKKSPITQDRFSVTL
jgi:hypothetical protein